MRQLLASLLVFALPLQGYAAATMLLCGPLHEVPMASPNPAIWASHAEAAPQHVGHDHSQHMAKATASHDGAGKAETGSTPATKVYGKCGLCAACCAAVALPSATPLFGSQPAPTHYVVAATAGPAGFLTGGIDRPPRPVFA